VLVKLDANGNILSQRLHGPGADYICPVSTTPVYRVFDNRPDANTAT
jgi:hypothetical protein